MTRTGLAILDYARKLPEYEPRTKKMKTNYHTHHAICDGKDEAEDYVRAAIEKGFDALGFSSHAPLPFANRWTMPKEKFSAYCAEIRRLREAYAGRIEVYLGLEIDFISGEFAAGPKARTAQRRPAGLPDFSPESSLSWPPAGLDYYIASVHVFPCGPNGYREVDHTPEEYEAIRDEKYGGGMRAFAAGYYAYIEELVRRFRPPVLGHLDLIKKNNPGEKYFSENSAWYKDLVRGLIPAIAEAGTIVEVNTGGLARGRTTTVYPSPWILRLLREADIPLMLNSDAHVPENLDAFFDMARAIIREAGYTQLRVLRAGGWETAAI
ncbi:MAG: histidinol-phosphatase [Spirochaetales bacterium]|jgi:histidinol-phosphatase (PHP family)|nr:histidinol-phosphatase [Spirochaetales bacterium]